MSMHARTRFVATLVLLGTLLVGCTAATEPESPSTDPPAEKPSDSGETPGTPGEGTDQPVAFAWADMELTDAVTGETFTLRDFSGTQVYVQAFAVW